LMRGCCILRGASSITCTGGAAGRYGQEHCAPCVGSGMEARELQQAF
jgi:hypothetical protein